MEIYLIRHGQSQWQVGKSTSKDSVMSDLGHEQAQYLNKYVKKLMSLPSRKSVVYVSPQIRAIQTVLGLQTEYIIEERLQEAVFHVAATLPQFSMPQVYERQLSNNLDYSEFKKNIILFLNDVILQDKNKNIFLYTHGGVIKTILRIIHDNDALCYTILNCSLTKLTWHRSRWHINFLNDVSFIPKKCVT